MENLMKPLLVLDVNEDPSSKQALRIAIRILRERCNTFQKRIAVLEEQNSELKSQLQEFTPAEGSLTEVDTLKQRIAHAEEQNVFLLNKMKIISQENLQLWSNLGKLTNANKSLGSHLNKINDSLTQHVNNHQPLIRSKTFTQERPTVNDSAEKLKAKEEKMIELEDVSLKLFNNFNFVQNELDSLGSLSEDFKNIEFDNMFSITVGYDDSGEKGNDFTEELKVILDELNFAKEESLRQNAILKETLQCLNTSKESEATIEPKSKPTAVPASKLCPVCSEQFSEETSFNSFVSHVESHFLSQDEGNL